MSTTPSDPPMKQARKICHQVADTPLMYMAGTTKVAPAATTPAAWPTDCTMTFSRMVERTWRRRPKVMARMAMGMDASMALPARRAM